MWKFWLIIATGLGFGYAPVASGTFGTLVGIPIVYWLSGHSTCTYLWTTLILFIAGIYATSVAERHFERGDPGQVVIDEIVGYLVTMFLAPVTTTNVIVGFILFRFFDVLKPWPAKKFDQSHGAHTVMLDDVFAGLYAFATLHLLRWIF